MNKRCIALLLAMVLGLSLLTGCGGSDNGGQTQTPESVAPSTKLSKPPAEDQILYDVNSFGVEAMEMNNAVATSCEIIKRQTNEENKEDIAYVRVVCEGEYSRFEYQFRLLYIFYDVGGWILEDVSYENADEWTETYIAADGGDLMDSFIWLDEAFTPDMFMSNGRGYGVYLGTCAEMHYFGVPAFHRSERCFSIYDHEGNQLTDVLDEALCEKIERVFLNDRGEVRLVLKGNDEGKHCEYLADKYGNRLSENYSGISPLYFDEYGIFCETWDRDPHLFGAVDQDGNLLLDPIYETGAEVETALGVSRVEPNLSSFERYKVVFERVESSNGSYRKYYFEDGTPIKLPNEGDYIYDYDGGQGLFYIEDENCIRFYDIDGNVRSPYLMNLTSGNRGTDDINLISYEGRCGILPSHSVTNDRITSMMQKK